MKHIKRRIKNKFFHDKRCRKLCEYRQKHAKKSRKKTNPKHAQGTIILRAPKELSVFDATETSLSFFEHVMDEIKQCKPKQTLYFDLSEVEIITPDAIMYLIAIINNTKKLQAFQITCAGNMPKDLHARAVFQDTGFFKFVYAPHSQVLHSNTKYMKIQNGIDTNTSLAGAFCEFVQSNCAKSYIATKRLYPMIIELMANTYQHAYGSTNNPEGHLEMNCNWYLFAQDTETAIHFIFLDTGVGIPRTVTKKFHESVSDLLNSNNDAVYIESALMGNYSRSETKLSYRGKGLPGIYEDCKSGQIWNLKIISCTGKCIVQNNASITSQRMDSYLEGTLFSWDIAK